jgi:hypothetical protein
MTDRMNITDAIFDAFGLKGEFTKVDASKLASPTSSNPIAKAHFAMIRELARMRLPSIGVSATPEDFEDVADYLVRVTSMFDMFLQSVGEDVRSNALCNIDLAQFSNQFAGAIDGNAVYELTCAAEAAREAQDEDADCDYRYDEQRDSF